jgi:hypothetical protein
MSGHLVRLKNNRGADEANVCGKSFPRHSDSLFYVDEETAQKLEGRGGFCRVAHDERPEAGTASLEEVIDTIFALDLGPIRFALLATLSAQGAL